MQLKIPVEPASIRTHQSVVSQAVISPPILNRILSFPVLIVAVLIAKVFWTCRGRIADPDLWWHLRNAQVLFQSGHFATIDNYSFTAAGAQWIDHSWLGEVIYYGFYRLLGLQGVFLALTVATCILVVSVFFLCRKETQDALAAAVATIMGTLLAMVGFSPRAQHFGWLCFVCIFSILLRYRRERNAPLWLLPPLFCLWINCHGAWPFGFAVCAIFFVSGLAQKDIGPLHADSWSSREIKRMLAVAAASACALFINPFGYRLVFYPFDLALHQKLNVANIEEWASVNFNDPRGPIILAVLGLVFAAALLARKRWAISDALLTVFALYFGLTHIRFLLLAGIVLPPVIAPRFGKISSYQPGRERKLINAVLLTGVAAVLILGFPSKHYLEQQIQNYFPTRAVEYLRAKPIEGKLFNSYEWGGYLEWNFGEEKTFIDSRTDLFEQMGVLKDYLDIINISNSQQLLDKYEISAVLIPAGTSFDYFLSQNTHWKNAYRDKVAVVYRRVEPAVAASDERN